MLMEEMEQDGHKVPKGVHTKIVADRIDSGDWLAVIYDKNWWLAKVITMDTHHQGVNLTGPSSQFHPNEEQMMCASFQSKRSW